MYTWIGRLGSEPQGDSRPDRLAVMFDFAEPSLTQSATADADHGGVVLPGTDPDASVAVARD